MITTDELTAIKSRADAATPGPWVPFQPGDYSEWWWVWQESALPYYGGVINCESHGVDASGLDYSGGIGEVQISDGQNLQRELSDATFIAHARTDVPSLVAEVERLQELLERIDRTLRIPAAEYVPAIGDVFTLIDNSNRKSNAQ